MQGKIRRVTLNSLKKGPRTPSNIAGSSGENLSHISRALKELVENGLAECMTPEQSKNRIYMITEKGNKILEELRKMEE